MIIFGVDLGTRRIAIACPQELFVWSVSLERAADRRQFATELQAGGELGQRSVQAIVDHFGALRHEALFFAERPFLRTVRPNVQTAVGMALSAGAALNQLPGHVELFKHPSVWMKEFCGNGNANKDDIRRTVEACAPQAAALCGEDENRFDAVGIALAGAAMASDGGL